MPGSVKLADMGAKRLSRVIPCAVLGLILTAAPGAATVLFTSYNTPCTPATDCSFEGGPAVPTLEQQFTLTVPSEITSVDAALAYSIDGGSYPSSDLLMDITNDSSNTPGIIVYGADTGVTGTLPQFPTSGTYNDINFAFDSVVLNPGTYWLVLKWGAESSSLYFDWEYQVPDTVDSPGVGGAMDALSGFGSSYTSDIYMANVNGSTVPEPATAVTLLGGLASLWIIRRRNASR
jgi:hypothetical protein